MKTVITGANGGVGKAIYNMIKDEDGYELIGIGGPDCSETRFNVDYSNPAAVQSKLTDWSMAGIFDGVERIIHCAGVNYIAPHSKLSPNDILDLLKINAIGDFMVTRQLLQHGLKLSCHIISDASFTPMTHSLAYNVSKAAQLMVMRQMAHEIKPSQCLIFGVSPGKITGTNMSNYIDSTFPRLRSMTYQEGRDYQLSRLRTGEMFPSDVARFVQCLLLDANKHMHGQNYVIGG